MVNPVSLQFSGFLSKVNNLCFEAQYGVANMVCEYSISIPFKFRSNFQSDNKREIVMILASKY